METNQEVYELVMKRDRNKMAEIFMSYRNYRKLRADDKFSQYIGYDLNNITFMGIRLWPVLGDNFKTRIIQ
jgi:hypothetical protein